MPTELEMIRRILQEYYETYNDEKTFPREDHPSLWEELDFIEKYLRRPE